MREANGWAESKAPYPHEPHSNTYSTNSIQSALSIGIEE